MRSISFVIPCYNEEKRLKKTFAALDAVRLPRGLKLSEIVFIDDGSTDKTFERIANFAKRSVPVTIISYKKNRGKGYAIRQGMLALIEAEGLESKADYVLFFDADMSVSLVEIKKIAPFLLREFDVIIGTRKNGGSTVTVHQPLYREILGRAFTKITQLVLGVKITDFTCGFKAFSRKAVRQVFPRTKIDGWGYDAEVLFLSDRTNLKMVEVPVAWSNDPGTKVKLGSAIINTSWELIKIRYYHSVKPLLRIGFPSLNIKYKISNSKYTYQKSNI
jgi:dolichyl-phosphate beta-glucosyltransferase